MVGFPLIHALMQGEKSWGLHTFAAARGSPTRVPSSCTRTPPARAVRCNGRNPSLPEGDQDIIYLMTCTPLSAPEDLKVLIREGVSKLCPPDLVQPSFEALRFFLSPGESGTTALHLLLGLHVASEVHMRLRDIFLCQLDFIPESPVTTLPWSEPLFAAPSAPPGMGTPPHQRTPGEVANLLKTRFRPTPVGGKKPKEVR